MLSKEYFLPAYIISNENQRWATNAVPNVKSILTVTGSGDQALFYTLAGIKIIDTFDITQNAGVIQDIKYTAIKHLPLNEYVNLLKQLHHSANAQSIPQFQKIKPFLSKHSFDIMQQVENMFNNDPLVHIGMFGNGLSVDSYPENLPTDSEYQTLKSKLNKPFKFICIDLEHLVEKLSKKYDLINLSNIFDYCYDGKTQGKILMNLSKHLNVGGHIAYLPQLQKFDYRHVHICTPDKKSEIIYKQTIKSGLHNKMILFQRIR